MNFKKRVNGSWTDTPHYIMGTSTDTIATPADIYVNDTTATVGLKGNMSRTGTPTPTTPIQPSECGERTGNLAWTGWAQDYVTRIKNINSAHIDGDILHINANAGYSEYDTKYIFTTTWKENTRYTFSLKYNRSASYSASPMMSIYYTDGTAKRFPNYENDDEWHVQTVTSDANKTIKYVACFYSSGWLDIDINTFMVVEGVTAPASYIPYGYKIPISSNNTTTPVYLGEVETTRKIRKYVIDGTENWIRTSNGAYYLSTISNPMGNYKFINADISINSHFPSQGVTTASMYINDGKSAFFYSRSSNTREYYIAARDIPTLEDFKAYLSAQYAAGTPVTVWYVLATPETAVVNEPLRKIGDYADSVLGITIPTTAGANTLTVDTTLQPSEVTVNYRGWHPVQSVRKRENGAWT